MVMLFYTISYGSDDDDDNDDNSDDGIYIMMMCLSVCHEK